MKLIKSYIRAIQYVISLATFKEDNISSLKFNDESYSGLNGEDTIVRIFYSNNKSDQSIIIFPGASPYAEKHPGVMMLGNALCKAGYTVYLPQIPDLKNLDINQSNIEWFAHCYKELVDNHVKSKHNVMIVGLSFGGAALLKASQDSRMQNPKPKSILSYGTYYSMDSALNFFITGKITLDNKTYNIKPHEWGIIVMFYNFLDTIETKYNSTKIKNILKNRIKDNFELVEQEIKTLNNKEADFVNNIINGNINDEIATLAKNIIQANKELLKNLSPINWAKDITNKVFILHGANDSMVPFTESHFLNDALPNSEMLISFVYEHREISTDKGILFKAKELLKMISFFANYFKYNA